MTSPQPSAQHAPLTTAFERTLVDGGTDPAVAAEIERRIRIVEDEHGEPSRLPMSGREVAVYVGVSVVAVAVGLLVVVL